MDAGIEHSTPGDLLPYISAQVLSRQAAVTYHMLPVHPLHLGLGFGGLRKDECAKKRGPTKWQR